MDSTCLPTSAEGDAPQLHNRFKWFFFFSFLGNGVFMPYLALYLVNQGVQGFQLGVALGTLPLARLIAQPLWGMLGDAYKIYRPILTLSLFALGGMALILTRVSGFWPVFLVIVFFAVMDAPYIPFGTTLALDYLERRGQTEQFGPLRLWGSVGYIVSALGIGALLLDHHLALLPYVFAGVMLFSGLLSLLLPAAASGGQTFHWRDSLTLLAGRSEFGWFLLGIALCGSTVAIGSQYLSIYLEQLEAAGWMIGLAIGLQAAMEIPVMGSMPAILRRFGVPAALLAGVAVLPLRWFLHVVLQQPLFLLPVQLLHGFTISGVMVVGALWVNGRLPLHLRATGQALYTAVFGGVGWGLGLLAAGVINEWFGMRAVWITATIVSIAGVLIVWVMLRRDREKVGDIARDEAN